jgi:apolipoprotein D and lipocalin family protein
VRTGTALFGFFCALALLSGCGEYPPLEVVPRVDLQRYAGKWYEVASLPVSQQEGCNCTTAEYAAIDGETIRVVNRCRKGGTAGELSEATGTAYVVAGSNNAKLRVQFFWPFRGDYWILDLAEDYSYAVVGTPSRKYFWILSRTPTLPEETVQQLLTRLREKGFDTARAQRTNQGCG